MGEKGKFTHISTTLLPIEDIGALLKYKHGFTDIKSLGVESYEQLALAAPGTNRHTVENALNLGGIPSSQYMTLKDGEVMRTVSLEVADLRDEVYQLKAELGRKGLVTNYDNYAGFHETFQDNDRIYVDGKVGNIVDVAPDYASVIVDEEAYNNFAINDWMIVEFNELEQTPVLVRVTNKTDGSMLHIRPNLPMRVAPETAILRKSLGRYYKGSYAFIKNAKTIMGDAKYSTLDDDTYTTNRLFNDTTKGIGYTFKINDFMLEGKTEGFFCEMNIRAARKGNPDGLVAYLMYEKDIEMFRGIDDALFLDSLCIGKSRPASLIDAPEGKKEIMRFDFIRDDGTYPTVQNMRMCVILVAVDDALVNANNYYQITFISSGAGTDLQANNQVYVYDLFRNGQPGLIYTDETMNDADLQYNYMIRPILDEYVQPHTVGLYSKQFKTNAPVLAERARVTMRINREGLFKASESGTVDWIRLAEDRDGQPLQYNMTLLDGIGARAGDEVIVGRQFAKYDSQMPGAVLVNQPLLVSEGDHVYRMGYQFFLRAKQVDRIRTQTGEIKEQVTKETQKELTLVSVIPDRIHRKEQVSDRLVFECDLLEEDDASYNEFEIQICWKTAYVFSYSKEVYPLELHGAIQDLALSLERKN